MRIRESEYPNSYEEQFFKEDERERYIDAFERAMDLILGL